MNECMGCVWGNRCADKGTWKVADNQNCSSFEDADERECQYCGSRQNLQVHHLLQGRNRQSSEKYGLMVTLCADCHTGHNRHSAHHSEWNLKYKSMGQLAFEGRGHSREEFIQIFGRNYLD